MFLREKENARSISIQLVRTEYYPEKKRTYNKVVATIPSSQSTLSDEVRQLLNEDEVYKVESELARRAHKKAVDSHKLDIACIATMIDNAVNAMTDEEAVDALTEARALSIFEAVDRLNKELRRQGHKRPKKSQSTA